MVNIAFVTYYCPHYRTGFFEQFESRLEGDLDPKIFFTDHKENWQAYGDFDYEVLPRLKPRESYEVAPTLFYRLWQYDPDVIVSGPVEQFAAHASYLYAKATGTPFVLWTGEWTLPKTTLRTLTFPLIRRIYHGADSLAVYGPHIRDYAADLGVNRDKIHLAWNTTDIEYFQNPSEDDARELRDRLDIPEDAPVALYVGRHVKEKGLEYLIDAFREIVDDIEPTPYLLIVGDGDRRDELEERAADLDTVLFPGYVENKDLPPYYGLADVFVLPSIQTEIFREPWGLVVTEAMASGTPVITTSEVGIAAAGVVKDGENGYIVPERNPMVLADRLERLLTDEGLQSAMGETAAEVISQYDYDKMVDGFVSAIDNALGTQSIDS
ncbi:glycosyltransferase family 4 protein [Salarchaeum japonicum]|uniref:Glycosyl transferase family 1 domain-containing protein n=1 Tax=Salarchaeum japonicum TaxID=555573 RepID=A0AAV3T3P5_9EURY|nr:glycosyltransferase family 4 protein [Salarchaeum japonicum]